MIVFSNEREGLIIPHVEGVEISVNTTQVKFEINGKYCIVIPLKKGVNSKKELFEDFEPGLAREITLLLSKRLLQLQKPLGGSYEEDLVIDLNKIVKEALKKVSPSSS